METKRKIGTGRIFWVAVVAVGLLFGPGCTTDVNPVSGKRQMMGFSWSQEQHKLASRPMLKSSRNMGSMTIPNWRPT
jgi:hypothetical protein